MSHMDSARVSLLSDQKAHTHGFPTLPEKSVKSTRYTEYAESAESA